MDQDLTAGQILRRFVRPRVAVERCDLCSAELAQEHPHLVELATRQLHCACDPCAILFSNQGGQGGQGGQGEHKYTRVPRRILSLPDFVLTDMHWNSLMLPIQLAFFLNSTPDKRLVALYPSPAGATESQLPLDSWNEIVENNPVLKKMQPDVEALLVNRTGEKREYFIAPVDECYKLVGLIRMKWHGLSGGSEVWQDIDKFFASLKDRASVPSVASVLGEAANA